MADLVNPYELAADPRILTPPEAKEYEELSTKEYPNLTAVALGLSAAWIFYRKVIRRRLIEELAKNPNPDVSKFQAILSILYHAYIPSWLGTATPAAVAGYRMGAQEAAVGHVPDEYLQEIAEGYVRQLGEHLNEVSTQAVLEGFQAQLNRKHPAARAAQQVARAYGVPPRAMNTLVSIWNTEDPKKLVNKPVEDFREKRSVRVIEDALGLRDRQIGEVEAWNAKTSAKQIVWMYKQQEGIVPKNAKRTWVTAKDEKVCPSCGPMHRESAPVGEQFKEGVWTPPLHVNCRCDVILDFKPNDIDDALASLFEYEEVGKAYGKDMYDRDKSGRFAATESRTRRPTKVASLWDTVNAPSITEDIQRQLEQLKAPEPIRAPAPIKPIGSLKPINARPINANPIKAGEKAQLKQGQIKRQGVERPQLLRTLIPNSYKREVISTLKNVIPNNVPDKIEGGWERAPVPLVAVMGQWELGDNDDFVIAPDSKLFELEDQEHGGNVDFFHEIESYWQEEVNTLLDELYPGSSPEDDEGLVYGDIIYRDADDIPFRVDRASYRQALEEIIYGGGGPDSDSLVLEPLYPGDIGDEDLGVGDYAKNPMVVRASELARDFQLESWVYDQTPIYVMINHVRPPESERHGQSATWTNPGEFRKAANQGVSPVDSNLPFRTFYAEPVD